MSAPLGEAHHAGDVCLVDLQFMAAKTGTGSWLDRDPREIAARLGGLSVMAAAESHPSADTWARIIAFGLAGWVAANRAETLDPVSGDIA